MKNKYLLLTLSVFSVLTFLLLSVNMASASIGNLGTFKLNECISLPQTCADCTYNNISSVAYPDGTQAVGMVVMTKAGTEYNYSFCSTSKNGIYIVNGFGDPAGVKTVWQYVLAVNPSGGAENNTTFLIFFLVIATALLLLGFIFHNYIFAFLSGITFLSSGVYGMTYGFGSITNEYTYILSAVIIGLGAILSVVSSLDLLDSITNGNGLMSSGDDD